MMQLAYSYLFCILYIIPYNTLRARFSVQCTTLLRSLFFSSIFDRIVLSAEQSRHLYRVWLLPQRTGTTCIQSLLPELVVDGCDGALVTPYVIPYESFGKEKNERSKSIITHYAFVCVDLPKRKKVCFILKCAF